MSGMSCLGRFCSVFGVETRFEHLFRFWGLQRMGGLVVWSFFARPMMEEAYLRKETAASVRPISNAQTILPDNTIFHSSSPVHSF